MEFIPLENCKDRFLYRIDSRNLSLGVFNLSKNGFTGIREKMGNYFLFTEYHYKADTNYPTAYPREELESIPENMPLEIVLDKIDYKTRRPIAFDKPLSEGGRGWYFLDDKKASKDIEPISLLNNQLFDWLKKKETQYGIRKW